MPRVQFQSLFHNANPDALDLLDRMLAFDPSSRISVEEALEHRYLQIWHDASDEPAAPTTFDFGFEVVDEVHDMRKMILDEVVRFRQHVRMQPGQTQQMPNPVAAQGQGPVPIPDHNQQWSIEDPHPQEAYASNAGDLEQELHRGSDVRHQ